MMISVRKFALFVGAALAAGQALAAWQTPGVTTQEMAAAQAAPAPGITATISAPVGAYFNITAEDVSKAVQEQLRQQSIQQKSDVSLAAGTNKVIYSADHPLKLVLHGLQIDPGSKRWQAQANILSGNKTETVKPVSGTYIPLVELPVLTKQLTRTDVIEAKDLSTKDVPEQQMRKETVLDAKQIIGKSPRSMISPNRPIRMSEVSMPVVIKKGDAVQMSFTNQYMTIRATGTALQDGATGDLIRVKNDKSEKAVSGRVTGNGQIEVNQAM